MDRRGLWVLLNVVNVLATGGVALLWWWRGEGARAALRGPVALASNRRQLRRNRRYGLAQAVINAEFCALGAALIVAALGWDGAVPVFVIGGTAGFAAIWVQWAALAIWDWREMGEVGRLREDERRGIE